MALGRVVDETVDMTEMPPPISIAIALFDRVSAISAKQTQSRKAHLPGGCQRLDDVGAVSGGTQDKQDIPGASETTQRPFED